MKRRTFLIGGLSGVAALAATGCIDRTPRPAPSLPPTPSTFLAPAPADMVRSSWSADPYARGSFSFLGVGTNPIQRRVLAEPVGNRVFFAGEATSVDRPGTVLGARDTGTRAAIDVIAAATRGERVAVIGAGIAGATAARRLVDAGFVVTVLEARERVGGRINSRRVSGFDVPVELGADRLDTVSADDLLGQLRAAGVITLGLGRSTLVRASDGTRLEPSTIGRDTVMAAIGAIDARAGDESVAAAVYGSGLPATGAPATTATEDRVRSYLRNDVGIAFGADARDISARYGLREGSRDTDRIVLGGYERLIVRLLDGVTVWTTNVVSEIAYGSSGVNLRIATGESLRVDRVVVTVPLGVLKSRDIRFAPELPMSHTIASIGLEMGTTDKIWLRFDRRFWTTDAERWTTVGGDLDITEWLNLAPKTGSPILVGLVGGERAVALADLPDDEVVERARLSLEPFLGA